MPRNDDVTAVPGMQSENEQNLEISICPHAHFLILIKAPLLLIRFRLHNFTEAGNEIPDLFLAGVG